MSFFSIIFSVLLIAASMNWKPFSLSEERALISPPPHLEFFSFGFQMPLADSLWIRAIQDFDYCEKSLGKNLCKGNGWLASMLDALTNLAPDYEIAYLNGGLSLTILVSDYPGASHIFDKGTRLFPKNKSLNYSAAYHALIEEKNYFKAARLFVATADNGGPEWMYSLAARLYSQAGRREMAESLYSSLSKTDVSPKLLKRMREKIDSTK